MITILKRWIAPLLGYKWIIAGGLAAAAAIGGYSYFLGHTHGNERGFDRALDQYEINREALQEAWRESLESRDAEWNSAVTEAYNRLAVQFEKYRQQEQNERELRQRIAVLNSTIEEIRNEFEGSDLGGCNVSPEFDRLLQQAHSATTAGAQSGPDSATGGPDNP